VLKETISIFYFISLEGDFEGFNEFTTGAINRELQDVRIVCSFATAKFVRSSGATSCVVMEL